MKSEVNEQFLNQALNMKVTSIFGSRIIPTSPNLICLYYKIH